MAADPTSPDSRDRYHGLMVSLTQEILMALERSSRCCEETLPLSLFSRGVDNTVALLFSNFLVLSPIESLSHTRKLSPLSHTMSGVDVEYEIRSVHVWLRSSSFSILSIFFESKIGFFRRFCHSKIMLWLCPFTSSSYILTRGRERLRDILNTARRRG